jgi:hypothetical protein
MHRSPSPLDPSAGSRPRSSIASAARAGSERIAAGVRWTATAARSQASSHRRHWTPGIAPSRLGWLLLTDERPLLTARRG